jgi:hypothetical protein
MPDILPVRGRWDYELRVLAVSRGNRDMIDIVPCEQYSEEWHRARLGLPTASQFHRIFTSTGKTSRQQKGYAHVLLAEWQRQEWEETYQSTDMLQGKLLEEEARDFYAFHTGVNVVQVGFCYAPGRGYGASPDGLVYGGETDDGPIWEGMVEIKCPRASTHVGYQLLQDCPSDYYVQLQGQLLVTGLPWVDFLSYCPGSPPYLFRVERNAKFQVALEAALLKFINELVAARDRLTAMGLGPKLTAEPANEA